MTYAPNALLSLRAYLRGPTGLAAAALGIVGDASHTTGYHLGTDRLSPNDYSLRAIRDRVGVSLAASALDIGLFPRLRELSAYLVAEAQRGAAGTGDIREVIYSPDGKVVLRWDRERGRESAPRAGEASGSHRTHTHVSWYRDALLRDKTSVFGRFFKEVAVAGPRFNPEATPIIGTFIYETPEDNALINASTGAHVKVTAGLATRAVYAAGLLTTPDGRFTNEPAYLTEITGEGQAYYAVAKDGTFEPRVAPGALGDPWEQLVAAVAARLAR